MYYNKMTTEKNETFPTIESELKIILLPTEVERNKTRAFKN